MNISQYAFSGYLPDEKEMMSVKKTADGYDIFINPSSLTVLQVCPRKAMYNLAYGLVSKQPGEATTFGKAIHAFLEEYYLIPKKDRKIPPGFRKKIFEMCQGATFDDESSSFIYRATRRFIDEMAPLAYLEADNARSVENGAYLISEYINDKANDPYEVYVHDGKPLIESRYKKLIYEERSEFGKIKIFLFGTVDAVLQNTHTGQILVCDHKTSTQVGNKFFNRTKPNHQYTAYIHLIQQCLGLDVDNFMINVFQVKKKPKRENTPGPNFLQIITKRTEEDIQDFIQTVAYYVKQYLFWIEDGYFPYGPVDACGNYGACPYLEVCGAPESIKQNLLEFNYKTTKEAQ